MKKGGDDDLAEHDIYPEAKGHYLLDDPEFKVAPTNAVLSYQMTVYYNSIGRTGGWFRGVLIWILFALHVSLFVYSYYFVSEVYVKFTHQLLPRSWFDDLMSWWDMMNLNNRDDLFKWYKYFWNKPELTFHEYLQFHPEIIYVALCVVGAMLLNSMLIVLLRRWQYSRTTWTVKRYIPNWHYNTRNGITSHQDRVYTANVFLCERTRVSMRRYQFLNFFIPVLFSMDEVKDYHYVSATAVQSLVTMKTCLYAKAFTEDPRLAFDTVKTNCENLNSVNMPDVFHVPLETPVSSTFPIAGCRLSTALYTADAYRYYTQRAGLADEYRETSMVQGSDFVRAPV